MFGPAQRHHQNQIKPQRLRGKVRMMQQVDLRGADDAVAGSGSDSLQRGDPGAPGLDLDESDYIAALGNDVYLTG